MNPNITVEFTEEDLKKILSEHVEKEYFSNSDLRVDEVTILDSGRAVVKMRKNSSIW